MPKRTPKTTPAARQLKREEWDFSKSELRWCDVYEHAREHAYVPAEVNHLWDLGYWRPSFATMFIDVRHAQLAAELFKLFPEFPTTPFLCIDAANRAERCSRLNKFRDDLMFQIPSIKYYTP